MDELVPARVVRQDKNRYRLLGEAGEYPGHLAGRFRREAEGTGLWPVVGDWVAARVEGGAAVVQALLPRRSAFSRKEAGEETREQVVAANLDTLFVVAGLDGDFNLRRIERYVMQAWNGGVVPVLLLNKADLCDDVAARVAAVGQVAPGADVHAVSAAEGSGVEALAPYVGPGRTVALVGSSGVGKSTLVNRLIGAERMRTNAVREDDSRGRHTTTHRELLVLPSGGLLIDTPGLRELQLWGDEAGLHGTFTDVDALAAHCRFRDCTHGHEPGCAVRAAVAEGRLDAGRLRSYQKLRRELDYLALRQQESATYREHLRGRKFGKMVKEIVKHSPKNAKHRR